MQLLAFGFFRTREDTILPGDDSDAATGPALEGTASQLVQDSVKKHSKPLDIGGAGLRKNAINAGRLDIGGRRHPFSHMNVDAVSDTLCAVLNFSSGGH